MARKASPVKVEPIPEVNQQAYQEEAGALTMLGAIAQGMHEERDLVNQLLGQAQMAEAFAKFSKTVLTSKLAFVKEHKLYRALKGQRSQDGLEFSGTWAEFCNLLGWTPEHANEAISSLHAFGEEALESMSRMGIGYRELRQWRKLPDDARSALIEASKQGNKEAVEYLAEELIATHTKEKEELQAKLEDAQREHNALSQVEADTSKKLRDTKLELERARLRTDPWSDKVATFQEEIAQRQILIDEALGRHFQAIAALDAWWTGEAVNQPDYDPETYIEMPLEVRTVLVELDDAINRTAHLVAAARNDMLNRFGDELALARQHLLPLDEQAE
ncbi:hypothetical protein [Pseudomonas aeruginosa]